MDNKDSSIFRLTLNIFDLEQIWVEIPAEYSETFLKDYNQFLCSEPKLIYLASTAELKVEVSKGGKIKEERLSINSYHELSYAFEAVLRYLLVFHNVVLFHAAATFSGGKLNLKFSGSESKTVWCLEMLYLHGHKFLGDDRIFFDLRNLRALPFHRYIVLNRPRAYEIVFKRDLYWIVFIASYFLKGVLPKFYTFVSHRPIKFRSLPKEKRCNRSVQINDPIDFAELYKASRGEFEEINHWIRKISFGSTDIDFFSIEEKLCNA